MSDDVDLLTDDERRDIEEALYRVYVDTSPGVRDEDRYDHLTDRLDDVTE